MKTTTTNAVLRLVATKDGEKIWGVFRSFKELSEAHHKLAREGWTVTLPL